MVSKGSRETSGQRTSIGNGGSNGCEAFGKWKMCVYLGRGFVARVSVRKGHRRRSWDAKETGLGW